MKENKGIKIQVVSQLFAVIGLILLVFLGTCLKTVVSNYKELAEDLNLHMNSHDYIAALKNGSDDMTEQSRLFAVTKDPGCMKKYFDIVDNGIRENAHDNLIRYFVNSGYDESVESLDIALNESNALMDTEIHSMKLVTEAMYINADLIPKAVKEYPLTENEKRLSREEKLQNAIELVFGTDYRRNKDKIDADIVQAVSTMSDELEDDMNAGMNRMGYLISQMITLCLLLAVLLLVIFILIRVLVIRPLQIYVKCIQENRMFDLIGSYELKYLALTYNNIFEVNQANKMHTDYLLEHDALTGACSRLAFEEQKKILSQTEIPIAFLMIDVDHFKEVNDTFGHESGDQALIRVVKVIRSLLRSRDIVARVGGDEFAVVLMDVTSHNKGVIGEKLDRINAILQNPEDGSPKLSLSIGVAFSDHGYSEELFQNADHALYEAKTSGRCGYKMHLIDMGNESDILKEI